MTDDDHVIQLLRAGLPPVANVGPGRDVWPMVAERDHAVRWSWFDVGMAAAVVTVLLMFPDWVFLLAFHL